MENETDQSTRCKKTLHTTNVNYPQREPIACTVRRHEIVRTGQFAANYREEILIFHHILTHTAGDGVQSMTTSALREVIKTRC